MLRAGSSPVSSPRLCLTGLTGLSTALALDFFFFLWDKSEDEEQGLEVAAASLLLEADMSLVSEAGMGGAGTKQNAGTERAASVRRLLNRSRARVKLWKRAIIGTWGTQAGVATLTIQTRVQRIPRTLRQGQTILRVRIYSHRILHLPSH